MFFINLSFYVLMASFFHSLSYESLIMLVYMMKMKIFLILLFFIGQDIAITALIATIIFLYH